MRQKVKRGGVTQGGCPCGFWSNANCVYVRAAGICRTPPTERPKLDESSTSRVD